MKKKHEILDYDDQDTTTMIDVSRPKTLADLGLKLPATPPSQVISIRLPTALLNKVRAKASQIDTPYQALIKMTLAKSFG